MYNEDTMNNKKSFWSTLPGILTGIAAVITAIGGTVGVLYQTGVFGSKVQTYIPAPPSPQNHDLSNLGFEGGIEGWELYGSKPQDYSIGSDNVVVHKGIASGYIKSIRRNATGFGTMMHSFNAGIYRGKRVRMTAYVKTEKISGWSGLWMRVDGPGKQSIIDNMENRPITGDSEWTRYECVLEVPEGSKAILFGILIEGNGKAWVDDFNFEIVGSGVPTTNNYP
jgi:hypothetical protein